MTIKNLADELGVSKQAVYKRVTGKLKSVLAPYVYTEYNRMCLTDEGAAIVKKDFEENPCATPLFAYGTDTERTETSTEQSKSNIEQIKETHTEHSREPNINTPECSESAPKDTERIENIYETLQQNIKLQTDLLESEQKIHEKEIELIKSQAEIEKLKETIKHLEQRIDDKDELLSDQRLRLQKTDDERKVLTASLFRNNEFIEKLMHLPLSKRIFGWKDVQNALATSQNDTAENFSEGESVTISDDESE